MYTKNDIQVAYDKIIGDGILGREDFQIACETAMVMRGLRKSCDWMMFMVDPEKEVWIKPSHIYPDPLTFHRISLSTVSESGWPLTATVVKSIGCLDGMDLTPDILEGGYRVMSVRCMVRREVAFIKGYHKTPQFRQDRTLADLEENLLLLTGLVTPN